MTRKELFSVEGTFSEPCGSHGRDSLRDDLVNVALGTFIMSCRASAKFRTIFSHFLANQSANASHSYIQRAFSRFGDGCVKVLFGESRSKITAWTESVNHKLNLLSDAFAKQCNGLAAQRVRRSNQLLEFYKQLYGDKIYDKVIRRLGVAILRHCKGRVNPVYMVIGGVPFFTWEKEKISDEEIER